MAAKESKFCDETLQDQRVPWYKWNAEHFICQDCYNETCQIDHDYHLEKVKISQTVRKSSHEFSHILNFFNW